MLTLPRTEWGSVGLLYDPAQFRDDGAYLLKNMPPSEMSLARPGSPVG